MTLHHLAFAHLAFATCIMVSATLFTARAQADDNQMLAPPVVTTAQGRYSGAQNQGVTQFLGIPYAQPPVGKWRWQPPRPMRKHRGTIAADQLAPMCLQTGSKRESSEDCLSLNIWTPGVGQQKRPVMVWIHGGGFRSGSNDINGEALANPNTNALPAVVVSLNYRLGPLGFLAHESLRGKHANFGLLDMVQGLRWVRSNIEAFGGDPANVTIFGVSAGGMAINMLQTSDLTEGLFHRAIAQSGYGTWPLQHTRYSKITAPLDLAGQSLPAAESAAKELIARLHTGKQTRAALYQLDGQALMDAVQGFHLPYVDGQSMLAEPGIRFAAGKAHRTPFITGGNSNEGSVMPGSGVTTQAMEAAFAPYANKLRQAYAADFQRGNQDGWQRIFGDTRYLLAAQVQGKSQAQTGTPTWLYYIDFIPAAFKDKWIGTAHGADAYFLFNGHTAPDPAVKKFTQRLRSYWLNFALTGNPNTANKTAARSLANDSEPDWQPYTAGNPNWLRISHNNTNKPAVIEDKLSVLVQHYQQRISPIKTAR